MTGTQTRIRSMKARRSSTCPSCRQPIRVGHRIIRLGGRWICIDCALTAAGYPATPETRTAP